MLASSPPDLQPVRHSLGKEMKTQAIQVFGKGCCREKQAKLNTVMSLVSNPLCPSGYKAVLEILNVTKIQHKSATGQMDNLKEKNVCVLLFYCLCQTV